MKVTALSETVLRLGEADVLLFQQLIQLFNEVFETAPAAMPKDSYLINLLSQNQFVALVIVSGNEVVAGLTAYQLPLYYGAYSEMYIYDIAVKPAFQRRGLGVQLLSWLRNYCGENGIRTLFVEAEETDKQAIEFYRSTGGSEQSVIHFNYFSGKAMPPL